MPTRDYDTWKTSPPEPKAIAKCAHCECDLYADGDYVHDRNENEWFCDTDCFLEKLRDAGDLVTETIDNES
jgi:hypothetical protein